ncbi:DUF4062 domain-containing protein [Lentzea aerocolonigenes]|uniref:DUF4062 domain-containing protein n=1 Tax=Lentzea aerocolonigenes TaxID=68170 RepID=UPI0004C2E9DE|nr:DUF4062 domain-containing protein [Lentzea aerocolonigenes]MCP2248281.1 protein of unknown function (DUF4062) [Lentzea aerocolonigenes]
MARVYVSSTFADLPDHREAVRRAIRRLGHEDIAMEYYVAEDVRPVEKCLTDVRSADLYIVIMAWRYGFIPPGDEKSITEQEYRAALDAGVPCLAFVLSDDEAWPPKLMERSPKVDEFREELLNARIAGLFTSKDDLARQVGEGIQKWERSDAAVSATTDWGEYRQAVVERYRWVRLSVIAGAQHDRLARVPLLEVFVPQQLRSGRPNYDLPDDEGVGGPALAEDSIAVLGREPKQVILGGPGSGKSTLFQAALLAMSDIAGDGRWVPSSMRNLPLVLLIELREYVLVRSPDFLSYLGASIWERFNIRVGQAQLADALDCGAVVFFDGLDEIFDPAARSRVIDQFCAFTSRFPNARVVVSSRIVGYDESELGLSGFQHYTLLDFGLKEIREFVPRWYRHYSLESDQRDAAGLVRRIEDNPRLQELAGNPLLLTMMAVIYKHQDLPEKRWQLYERCTGVLLEDWDVKRKKIDTKELLPLDFRVGGEQKAEILQNIAMTMLSSSCGAGYELNAIAYGPLRDIIGAYLERQYAKSPGEAQAIAREILNHLRERTFILAETGDGIFGFVHRTFMEYFAARHVLAEFNRRKADYRWLKQEVYAAHWDEDQWREPLLLLSAMLAGQGSPIREVVQHLVSGFHLLVTAFAVRCLGEAGSVPPEDQEWATETARLLVGLLDHIPPRSDHRAAHAAEVVSVLGSIAGLVTFSANTLRKIEAYRNAQVLGDRIIGFQLELAVSSAADRLQAAVVGLSDDDEAVRRAAIASLEKESGNETVFRAFVEALRVERIRRVREPLITALDREWPRRAEVLEAIANRIPNETSYTHTIWLAHHLSVAWAGDIFARELVLRLARLEHPGAGDGVVEAVVLALLRGWRSSPDLRDFLWEKLGKRRYRGAHTAVIRVCAVVDLGLLRAWFWGRLVSSDVLRQIVVSSGRGEDAEKFILDFAREHPHGDVRREARRVHELYY